jgi:hypothetical protein
MDTAADTYIFNLFGFCFSNLLVADLLVNLKHTCHFENLFVPLIHISQRKLRWDAAAAPEGCFQA